MDSVSDIAGRGTLVLAGWMKIFRAWQMIKGMNLNGFRPVEDADSAGSGSSQSGQRALGL
jgi:hypothetical protein